MKAKSFLTQRRKARKEDNQRQASAAAIIAVTCIHESTQSSFLSFASFAPLREALFLRGMIIDLKSPVASRSIDSSDPSPDATSGNDNSYRMIDHSGGGSHNDVLGVCRAKLRQFGRGAAIRKADRLMLKTTDLDEFKQLLVSLRARVRGDVEQMTTEALDRNGDGGESKSPTHLAELGTENYEQDFALRRVENEQELLDEIGEALRRIDKGGFGQCEICLAAGLSPAKAAIPKARLKVIPYARNCVECERKRERTLG